MRINDTSTWSNYCDEVKYNESVICNCIGITPTTIYDVNIKLIEENLINAFRNKGVNAISTFNFLYSSAFYIIIALTIIYLITLLWSIKKDRNDRTLIIPLHDKSPTL